MSTHKDNSAAAAPDAALQAGQPRPLRPAARQRELTGRLAGKTLSGQVLTLALWPFLENLLGFLVNFVDLMLGGRLGEGEATRAAMDALAIGGYFHWLVALLQSAVGIGATALIARAIGGRKRALANLGLAQAMQLSLVTGSVAAIGIYTLAPLIATGLGLEGESVPLCISYLRIVALGSPFAALLLIGNACLRGAGDTRSPFYAMVTVNVVNIVVSVMLVQGPAPIGGHGLAGIAAGTAVAWAIGSLVVLGIAIRGSEGIRLRRRRLGPHLHTIRRILRVGIPSMAESSGMWLMNIAVLKFVAMLHTPGAYGAHIITVRIEGVSYLPGMALGVAAATLMGQYLGLGDPHRAKRAAFVCLGVGAVTMGSMGVLFLAIPETLVALVSPNTPEHLTMAPTLLRICGPIQIFFAAYMVLGQALRGAGDTTATWVLSWSSLIVVRLGGAYLFGIVLGLGLPGIWIGLCADLTVKGLLFFGRFIQGGWQHRQV